MYTQKNSCNALLQMLILAVGAITIGCDNDINEPNSLVERKYEISGILTKNASPYSEVMVTIEGFIYDTIYTDENGAFNFSNLLEGKYLVTAHHWNSSNSDLSNTQFQKRIMLIEVKEDYHIGEIKLPEPIQLNDLDIDDANLITVSWTSIDDEDFTQYKVYRATENTASDLTGELVFSSGNNEDTIFYDRGTPLSTNYYKVYAYSKLGAISTSYTKGIKTNNVQLIKNSSFENLDNGNVKNWLTTGSVNIDNNTSHTGVNSVHLQFSPQSGTFINQSFWLDYGVQYELSLWVKHSGISDESIAPRLWLTAEYSGGGFAFLLDEPVILQLNTLDWQQVSYSFVFNDLGERYEGSFLDIRQDYSGTSTEYWIDDIELIVKE